MFINTEIYPRNCSIYGSSHLPSLVGAASLVNTCGVLVFATPDGNEYYIFMDGITPSLGGVNEVMTGGIGTVGCALGAAVAPAPNPIGIQDGLSVLGGQRMSSSVYISAGISPRDGSPMSGALAMATGKGTNQGARYLFMSKTAANTWQLCCDSENMYLQNTPGAIPVGTPVVGSGALGAFRDGRTIIGNDQRAGGYPPVLFVDSGGRGAGFAFEFGGQDDQGKAVVMYISDLTGMPTFVTPAAWLTWNGS